MSEARIEEYTGSFIQRNQGRIPVVLDLEPTLIEMKVPAVQPDFSLNTRFHEVESRLSGKRRTEIETLAKAESRQLHWTYYAFSILKSLCHDMRFAPVLVSPRFREVLVAKVYRGRTHPDILATTIAYDSRERFNPPLWPVTVKEKHDFIKLLSSSHKFPLILAILSQPEDGVLVEHAHCIALPAFPKLAQIAHYAVKDLREAQEIMWRLGATGASMHRPQVQP